MLRWRATCVASSSSTWSSARRDAPPRGHGRRSCSASSCCPARGRVPRKACSRSSTSTSPSPGGPRCCSSTSSPTPTRRARATQALAGRRGAARRRHRRVHHLNVQHVESLNDVVAQISGTCRCARPCPTPCSTGRTPSSWWTSPPEELLQRLARARSTCPSRPAGAVDHFFKRGNLLALRELALRRTAQHVDEDVREPTGEDTASGDVARRRAHPGLRGAERRRRATHPRRRPHGRGAALPVDGRLRRADGRRADGRCRSGAPRGPPALAESLGGAVTRLVGLRVSEALLDTRAAEQRDPHRLGKPTHSRWRDRLRGSLVDDVVRGSGDIEVHVISGDDAGRPTPAGGRAPRLVRGRPSGNTSPRRGSSARRCVGARAARRPWVCPTWRCCSCWP
jgi:hypothetical protein